MYWSFVALSVIVIFSLLILTYELDDDEKLESLLNDKRVTKINKKRHVK